MLVGVGGNPAVALKIKARLFLRRHAPPNYAIVNSVHAVEPIANPSGADLENHQLQLRKSLQRSVLNEACESMADRVRRRNVEEEMLFADVFDIVPARPRPLRFQGDVNSQRHVEFLSFGKQHVMVGMTMWLAGHRELDYPTALASRLNRAFQFAGGGLWITEREMCDGYQASAALRAPVHDPAIISAAHRLRVISIIALGFPGKPEAGINDRGVEPL